MRIVIFDYTEDEKGSLIYPDDKTLFKKTQLNNSGRVYGEYYGNDDSIEEYTPDPTPVRKTVYTREKFISMIPKAKIRAIKALAVTDDDVEFWLFNLNYLEEVDLNALPTWFEEGLMAMIDGGLFTEGQILAFIER